MDKKFLDADDQNVSMYIIYVDDEYVYLDKDKQIKATYDEVSKAFIKGCLININGFGVVPYAFNTVNPTGSIPYAQLHYCLEDGVPRIVRSSDVDLGNLEEIVKQLQLRIKYVEEQSQEHKELFEVLVGLTEKQ